MKGGKKPRQHRGYIGRLQNGVRIGKQTCRRLALIGQFVQHPAPMTEILSGINAANDQQGNGILSRLRHRRGNVSKPGPGDCQTNAGLSRPARVSVSHESRPLLVAGRDVADFAVRQTAIDLRRVHAGDTENMPHAVGFQTGD